MPILDWSKIVPASVVPVVGLSACGLLALAFYNRMVAIVARLRAFQRERLAHIEVLGRLAPARLAPVGLAPVGGGKPRAPGKKAALPDAYLHHQRLAAMLDEQTKEVLGRAKLIRRTLQFLLFTMASLTFCSLAMGASVLLPPAVFLATALFFLGMAFLGTAIAFAVAEIGRALRPVELESTFVERLSGELGDGGGWHSD
jgi:hypothetical protein